MSESQLTYLGPYSRDGEARLKSPPWWRRIPLAFLIVVVVPFVLSAVYFLLIASPRYVSEARFIVRAAEDSRPSSLGVALEGVGLATATSDAFAVHEYITSRDGFDELTRRFNLRRMMGEGDVLSRYPRPWEGRSNEDFYSAFQRFTTVGYDSTTGISTLRVEAFAARDAQRLNDALLASGEALVNRLNERASVAAVRDAEGARTRARERLAQAQSGLTAFRNEQRYIDPALTAREGSQLIGGLLATVAELRAERAQLAAQAPQSPQLATIDSRIRAYEGQISEERSKIAGNSTSLAPQVGVYEDLVLERELADKELTAANAALTTAEQDARRQNLYLDRIVNPSLPDAATQPKRLLSILTILFSALLVYGVGWFIWAGAREHRQA